MRVDSCPLQTGPLGKVRRGDPVHTVNITRNPNVPASTYGKVVDRLAH